MKKYLKLMRIKHYIKNLLILLPIIFSGNITNIEILKIGFLGFISFSLISSVVYIINDIRDKEKDSKHPTKKNRPIANGSVSVKKACILGSILFISALVVAAIASKSNIYPYIIISSYFIFNIAYSFGLKNIPIVDVAILVSGFIFRILFGSMITNIEISNWLYLTVITFAFYLGLGKRRNELIRVNKSDKVRDVLKHYNKDFLDKNMYMNLTLSIAFYTLWTIDQNTIKAIGSNNLIYSVPILILICMKYSLQVEGDSDGDPVEVLFKDKGLLLLSTLFSGILIFLIYF